MLHCKPGIVGYTRYTAICYCRTRRE